MDSTTKVSEWITVPEAAALLGVHPRTIKNMMSDGRLQVRTMHLSRNTRIHRGDWETELAKRIRVPASA